jgi:hypothetical protein
MAVKKPILLNPFGGIDEKGMIQRFYDIHGRDVAENLDRIRKGCYPMREPLFPYRTISARQIFIRKATKQGFKEQVIMDFLDLT